MKFVVKTTSVTDGLSILVAPPQSGLRGFAIGTRCSFPSGRALLKCQNYRICQGRTTFVKTYQSALWLDKWPVLAIHFVVKAAGVTQIMAISISSP